MVRDLMAIKAYNPDETAETLEDLGELFFMYLAARQRKGQITPEDVIRAYELARFDRGYGQEEAPAALPGVGRADEKKTYFSPADVDRLTDEDLDRPEILQRVMESMAKW